MNILIVNNTVIPALLYGGTERVIWDLAEGLTELGHQVSFLVKKGSSCSFATVHFIDDQKDLMDQIPKNTDLVHFFFQPQNIHKLKKPYIVTLQGNYNNQTPLDINTVFVSKNHASRFDSTSFVHNGLNWNRFGKPNLANKRHYHHFLANAAWRLKNVRGSIKMILKTKSEKLHVLGGVRFNINMGIRFTFSPRISFYGMVDDQKKAQVMQGSKSLIFPVLWHEPFGIAMIESLYFGCPVFGTTYGSLPEVIRNDVGLCTNNTAEMIEAIENAAMYNKKVCHEYARDLFNHHKLTQDYLEKYEKVLSNETLHPAPPVLKEIQLKKFLPMS